MLALALVVVGLWARSGLGEFWVNPDEGIYYSIVTNPDFSQAWDEILSNAHPPLFYLLLRGMGAISADIAWLRLPSLLAGLLSIYGVFLLGRRFGGDLGGLLAAFFMVWMPELVLQSKVMRPYIMQGCMLIYALWFLLRYLDHRRMQDLLLYTLLISLAALTHYSSFIAVGGIGIALLAQLLARRLAGPQILGLGLANLAPFCIGLALYFFHLKPHVIGGNVQVEAQGEEGWLSPYFMSSLGDVWQGVFGVMGLLFGHALSGPAGMLFLAAILGMAFLKRLQGRDLLLPLALGVLACALLFSFMRQYAFGASRHSLYLAPFIVLVLATALSRMLRSGSMPALVTSAAVLFLLPLGSSLTSMLGVEERPVNPEQLTLSEDMELMESRVLEPMRENERVMMMNLQSFYVLLPCLEDAPAERVWGRDFFALPWGESRILVNMAWGMTSGSTGLDKSNHLLNFVGRIDEQFPDLEIREQRDTWMFSAGWITPLADGLIRIDGEQPEGRKLIAGEDRLRFAGVKVFRWDLQSYVQVVESILKAAGK
jgi:hypothetical protein